jgi:hypothetical protein
MRRMVILASVWSVMVLAGTIGTALALDCHGRLVVIGANPGRLTTGAESPPRSTT